MADTSAPVLKTLKLPSVVNISNGTMGGYFEASATDIGLGVDFISIRADHNFVDPVLGAFPFIRFTTTSSSTINSFNTTAQYGHQLFAEGSDGHYSVSVTVFDKAGNFISYTSSQLKSMGLPYEFDIKDTTRGPGGIVYFKPDDPGFQVYRLYEATLDRKPDALGLSDFADDAASHRTTLSQLVPQFTNSQEFQNKYGAVDDGQFVTLLYNNVLDRGPDQGGYAHWTQELAKGTSRSDVVLGFSESAEFRNKIAAANPDGIWVQDPEAASVARLYYAVLDRAPDAGGLFDWTAKLEASHNLEFVAKGFTASAEFQTRYGSLDDDAFVELLYDNVLDRHSDAGGLSYWTSALEHGTTREQVVLGFSESIEHQVKIESLLENGFLLA